MRSQKKQGRSVTHVGGYSLYAILFLLSAVVLIIITPLFQKGTFIDGLLYQTVAYNASQHQATFWNMKFTDTSMSFFCEQPPLYFELLSWYYSLIPNRWWADHLFTLSLLILLIVFLAQLFKSLPVKTSAPTSLSLLFLVSIPVFCWSYANQILEPLVCIEMVLAIWLFVRYLKSPNLWLAVLFGGNIVLLFLSKGFQSCFIIALPLCYAVLHKFRKDLLVFSALASVIALILIGGLIFFYAPAKAWFQCYYQSRLVLTMNNVGATTDSHFEIIGRFFSELIPVFILLLFAFLWLINKYRLSIRHILRHFSANSLALALLMVSFLGSFPFALSLVQRGFYLLPALLCFVLSLVIGFSRYWQLMYHHLQTALTRVWLRSAVVLIFFGSMTISVFTIGEYKKDESLLEDLALIEPLLNQGDTLGVSESLWNNFSLHAYLYMDKQVNLIGSEQQPAYQLTPKEAAADSSLNAYQKVMLPTRAFDLWTRR